MATATTTKKTVKKATTAKKKPVKKTIKSTTKKPKTILDKNGLTLKQKLFAKYYLFGSGKLPEGQEEFGLGNGTRSYALAYGKKLDNEATYVLCASEGSANIRKPHIKAYMDELLVTEGWNSTVMDSRLANIAKYGSDKDAISAAREFNKLTGRIVDKIEHSGVLDLSNTEDIDKKDLAEVKDLMAKIINHK